MVKNNEKNLWEENHFPHPPFLNLNNLTFVAKKKKDKITKLYDPEISELVFSVYTDQKLKWAKRMRFPPFLFKLPVTKTLLYTSQHPSPTSSFHGSCEA
jgi:hypothetical protein